MKKLLFLCLATTALVIGCSKTEEPTDTPAAEPSAANADKPAATEEVTFASIQPVIEANCIKCHGATEPKDGVNLTSYESVMKGGEHGPIVVAGDPENSVLVQALRGSHGKKQMPFKADPLPEDVIAKVEAWIKAGAKA